jgi:hypothetical protein
MCFASNAKWGMLFLRHKCPTGIAKQKPFRVSAATQGHKKEIKQNHGILK